MPRSSKTAPWWITIRKCGGRCWYCGTKPEVETDLTVDHAVPQSRGGSNADWNLLPCCVYCNRLKDSCTIHEFRKVVKQIVVRNLLALGYVGGNLSALKVRFYGEGYDSVLGY